MRTPVIAGSLVVIVAAGCGASNDGGSGEAVGEQTSAIQGGTDDTTHNFTVAIVESTGSMIGLCSGVLLAPNLVATARHCVSQLTSTLIDCSTTRFTTTASPSDMFVTPLATIPTQGYYGLVDNGIIVPQGTSVCGNDIALLILNRNITLPQYVTPAINPPMTDHTVYTTSYTAIGYGVDSPDATGGSAGVRRIRENINLGCIPNDKTFVDCFSFANAQQFIAAGEFEGGDGTCEGDSGSGAYDQGSFNDGRWVAFGVLSRGGVSAEGGTCLGSVYSRFDAWSTLVIDTAIQAAALGNYAPPAWASPGGDAAGSPPGDEGGVVCTSNGGSCASDAECCSVDCLSFDDGATFSCAACDATHPCNAGFGCQAGACVQGGQPFSASGNGGAADGGVALARASGCSVAAPGSSREIPWGAAATALGLAAVVRVRRRRSFG